MKLLKITPKVLNYYQSRVNDNKHVDQSLTMRKLTRNVKLAVKSPELFLGKFDLYSYGNLDIVVDSKKNRIVSIRNFKGASVEWFVKDEEKYAELNKKYKIDELDAQLRQKFDESVGL
jgi:hypothetical protein